jgi:hypothetical protein
MFAFRSAEPDRFKDGNRKNNNRQPQEQAKSDLFEYRIEAASKGDDENDRQPNEARDPDGSVNQFVVQLRSADFVKWKQHNVAFSCGARSAFQVKE